MTTHDLPVASARLLIANEVSGLLGISVRTLKRMAKLGQLPAPVRIGLRGTRWRETEIINYINGLKNIN